jgi:cytochrome c553
VIRAARAFAAATLLVGGAVAAETPPPRAAAPCAACHGTNGISMVPDAPNLAAQPRAYLVEQLKAFRSGKRASETMNLMAKNLADADILELADWYSSIVIEVKAAK